MERLSTLFVASHVIFAKSTPCASTLRLLCVKRNASQLKRVNAPLVCLDITPGSLAVVNDSSECLGVTRILATELGLESWKCLINPSRLISDRALGPTLSLCSEPYHGIIGIETFGYHHGEILSSSIQIASEPDGVIPSVHHCLLAPL